MHRSSALENPGTAYNSDRRFLKGEDSTSVPVISAVHHSLAPPSSVRSACPNVALDYGPVCRYELDVVFALRHFLTEAVGPLEAVGTMEGKLCKFDRLVYGSAYKGAVLCCTRSSDRNAEKLTAGLT
jgi:hypothetical protein